MELTPYQTHASIALIGFGVSGAVAGNTALAAGCFGGLGVLHLYVLANIWIADWRYERRQRAPKGASGGGGGSGVVVFNVPESMKHVSVQASRGAVDVPVEGTVK